MPRALLQAYVASPCELAHNRRGSRHDLIGIRSSMAAAREYPPNGLIDGDLDLDRRGALQAQRTAKDRDLEGIGPMRAGI